MPLLNDIFGYSSEPKNQNVGDLMDAESSNGSVVMIGVMGSGKTVVQAKVIKAADRKVSKSRGTEYPFRYILDEGGTDIIHEVAALRAGHFPPKTLSRIDDLIVKHVGWVCCFHCCVFRCPSTNGPVEYAHPIVRCWC